MTIGVHLIEFDPFASQFPKPRSLSLTQHRSYRLGRQPDCEIRFASDRYSMISRYHAIVEPSSDERGWQVRDLGSANGTFVNQQRLDNIHHLRSGDIIQLGQTGPQFRFEDLPLPRAAIPLDDPPGNSLESTPPRASIPLTLTQLFPLLSTGAALWQHQVFILGIITIAMGVSLFVGFGNPDLFNRLLAVYLAVFLYYIFIYQLCDKRKSWGLILLVTVLTAALIKSPVLTGFLWFFRQVLPGTIALNDISGTVAPPSPLTLFSQIFVGTGLMEELLKALPVLGLAALSLRFPAPWRSRWGIEDPLDGILLCSASALSFTLLETLGQYVPAITQQIGGTAGLEAGQLAGLQLLIPRLLGAIAGHLAYSGYWGYFIGLVCLNPYSPAKGIGLILLGYGSAALLHTLWNLAGTLSPIFLVLSGILSYSLLMGAILKARSLRVYS